MIRSKVQISSDGIITRERKMPSPGKIFTRRGEHVSSLDVIAESMIRQKHFSLNIARGLGVSNDDIHQHLHFKENDIVRRGLIVAGPVGFTKRIVRAPISGKIIDIFEGVAILRNEGESFQLRAGLSGEVDELIPGRGAIIKSYGSVIQGVWGNGSIGSGELVVLDKTSKKAFTADDLTHDLRKKVILGGYCEDSKVIKKAAELPLGGLILSSITPELLSFVNELPFPFVLLEGFGRWPINSTALKIFNENHGQFSELNGEGLDRGRGTRPEVIIPKNFGEANCTADMEDQFHKGQLFRVVSHPHLGKIGKLNKLRGVTRLPNGLFAPAAEVILEEGTLVVVPLVNLEAVV